jgi:predicted dehydrogenase
MTTMTITMQSDRPPTPLRVGILGAARIAPMALVRPARTVPEVSLAAVAARDPEKARAFAAKHGIPRVHESYAALIADPGIDAIYNPLPNSLHAEWTIRALEAGKHVLCEKPLAANATEAEAMVAAAGRSQRVLIEAFHYYYHPLFARMREIVESGELGKVRRIETALCVPLWLPGDIRYRLDLAGGATMDLGCYALHMLRNLAGAEPEVLSAEARLSSPQVDRWMRAELRFADGRTGRFTCSMFSIQVLRFHARVEGEAGTMHVTNPLAPHIWHRLRVRTPRGSRTERVSGSATYTHQLRAFVAAVRGDAGAAPTSGADSIANMRAIDAVYRSAGLAPRGLARSARSEP